ncbi:hypothetical protein KAH81_09305 [bacterium]|nr:hypothetical protein [bacterium]
MRQNQKRTGMNDIDTKLENTAYKKIRQNEHRENSISTTKCVQRDLPFTLVVIIASAREEIFISPHPLTPT